MAIDFKEDVVGSGRSIAGVLIGSLGTALVAWIQAKGVTLTPEETTAVTGFVIAAWGITMKFIKLRRGK